MKSEINVKETYFGFTDSMKPMQKRKVEIAFDGYGRYDGEVMTEKEFIYFKLQEGYKPELEENYTYYKRNGDLSKPKTLYKLQKDDEWYEINKTLLNYASYLLENDFLNEQKANEFIVEEKRNREEKERVEAEEQEKMRLEEERTRIEEEEKSRKEREDKIKKWESIGRKHMNDDIHSIIKTTFNNSWSDFIKVFPENEGKKEETINAYTEEFVQKLGNQGYVDHILHICNDSEREYTMLSYPELFLQQEILRSIFKVGSQEDSRTITAKVKAFYEGRQYKGGKSKGTQSNRLDIFYQYKSNENGFVEVEGEPFQYKGIKGFLASSGKHYAFIELRSGMVLTQLHKTKSAAKEKTKELINKNLKNIQKAVEDAIKYNGLSPNVPKETSKDSVNRNQLVQLSLL